MEELKIPEYEPLVDEIKELIHQKQYQALKLLNTETINLYWEIGEEIYRQQEEKGWGKSIVQILSKELQKEFPGAKGCLHSTWSILLHLMLCRPGLL